MRQALRARSAIGHAYRGDIVRTQRLGGKIGHQRAVHPTGETDDDALEAARRDFVADELDQPAAGQRSINGQGIVRHRRGE